MRPPGTRVRTCETLETYGAQRSPNSSARLNSNRGTALWGVNRLRSDALVSLLDDLTVQEKHGIQESQCNQVQVALGFLVNSATAIPDESSWWRSAIWQELQDFLDIYVKWNSHRGADEGAVRNRRAALRKLRSKRSHCSKN